MPGRDMGRFAPEVEASVYRIAQEALNNVAKHARARSVNVLLEQSEANLVLVVEDDGVGLQPSGREETMIGLTGMRERAAAVGGTLELEPTPNGGATDHRAHSGRSALFGRAGSPTADSRRSSQPEPTRLVPAGAVAGDGEWERRSC